MGTAVLLRQMCVQCVHRQTGRNAACNCIVHLSPFWYCHKVHCSASIADTAVWRIKPPSRLSEKAAMLAVHQGGSGGQDHPALPGHTSTALNIYNTIIRGKHCRVCL